MTTQTQLRLNDRNFFWAWFLAVNATLLVATLWVGAIGLLAPLIGFGGALLSLLFAKQLAVRAHGIRIVDPRLFRSDVEEALHAAVADLAKRAGLETVPAVGIYPSPDVNAFATGASQRGALVAFSSRLMATLSPDQIRAVAAHEIAHIANRDMLAIVMLQGAINSVVLLLVAPLNLLRFFNNNADEHSRVLEVLLFLVKAAIALALTFVGGLVVKAFSRRREFRADALAAQLVGHAPMISTLYRVGQDETRIPERQHAYAAFKFVGRGRGGTFFRTHPEIEDRILTLCEAGGIGHVERNAIRADSWSPPRGEHEWEGAR